MAKRTTKTAKHGYLDLPPELSRYETARVAVLPCPFDGTSTYGKGADRGPAKLIEASGQVEFWDMQFDLTPCNVGIATLPAVKFRNDDPALAVAAIQKAAARPVGDGKFLLGLGGEHSVSIGLTRAVREHHGRFSLLHVDAHADLRAEYMGSPFNHACAIHAIAEDDKKAAIVSIGIRAVSEEEVAYAKRRGIHLFPGHVLPERRHWIRDAVALLKDPVYVTIDLDGLDPTILPSTGTPVPGGLGWWDAVNLIREIGRKKRVIACDVNELMPRAGHRDSAPLRAPLTPGRRAAGTGAARARARRRRRRPAPAANARRSAADRHTDSRAPRRSTRRSSARAACRRGGAA
jgi:agmatinase